MTYKPTPMYVCTDAIVYCEDEEKLLLVRRGHEPFKGMWALPGGYVEPDDDVLTTAYQELADETGVRLLRTGPTRLEFFKEYSKPDRDPRGRVISLVYSSIVKRCPELRAGDDAAEAEWRSLKSIRSDGLAFDHWRMISDFLAHRHRVLTYAYQSRRR